MTKFVSDSFTGTAGTALASHTGEVGATWAVHTSFASSAMVLSNANRLRANTTASNQYYASGTPATAEYDVNVTLHPMSDIGEDGGQVGRLDTATDTAYVIDLVLTNFTLSKKISGTWTQLGSYATTFSIGSDYVLKLAIRNAFKKACISGVEVISSSDNAIVAAGKAGIQDDVPAGGGFGDTAGLHWDNFSAVDAVMSRNATLNGLGASGAFFNNPLG